MKLLTLIKNLSVEKASELGLFFVVGVLCYGIMSFMCIYLLFHVIEWSNVLYLLITIAAFCLSMVGYSIFKIIKILKIKINE